MEIEVLVDADPVVDNSQKRYRAASAFFTYVSLSQEGKSLPVPQLVVSVCPWAACHTPGGKEGLMSCRSPSGSARGLWEGPGQTGQIP